jgi:hypothetical protein
MEWAAIGASSLIMLLDICVGYSSRLTLEKQAGESVQAVAIDLVRNSVTREPRGRKIAQINRSTVSVS